ncbi:MAG: aminotransferase class I/II-fold pyridoxal phosphate-dependent enzyme, partial [Spirochaetia bacterium]|nr:aminotransferase class I/II-fold pyridoxal phosphate-dependent enzyme [Spirochaetia bacterium]
TIYPDAMVLKGFSKTYNMTGLRLSYATGPLKVIGAMTVIQQYTVVCAPAPVQWAGLKALDLDMSSYIDLYRQNRNLCFEKLKPHTKFPYPSGAFYIFPEIPSIDTEFTEYAASEKKLIIVPGSIFSEKNNHVRISFATDQDHLTAGLDAFISLL